MDFEAVSNELNKGELMSVSVKAMTVQEATQQIKDQIDIQPLIDLAEGHTITSEDSAKMALSMSMQARKFNKAMEKSRMSIVRPHLDFQRAINTIVKDYTKKLEEIEVNLKEKLDSWLELQSTFEPNFTEQMLEVEDGKLTTKTEWEFVVENLDSVPKNYLQIDEKKVKQAIKAGIREISGLKIYEQKKTTMRIKNG